MIHYEQELQIEKVKLQEEKQHMSELMQKRKEEGDAVLAKLQMEIARTKQELAEKVERVQFFFSPVP
jgi:hypothetical protein